MKMTFHQTMFCSLQDNLGWNGFLEVMYANLFLKAGQSLELDHVLWGLVEFRKCPRMEVP